MKLSRLCSAIAAAQDEKPQQPDNIVYRCTLRVAPDPQAPSKKDVYFEVTEAGELGRIIIPQEGAIEIEFSFAGWRWNPPLDKSLFQFRAPPNAVIVDGLLPDTPGLRQ